MIDKNLPNKLRRIYYSLVVIVLFLFYTSSIGYASDKIKLVEYVDNLRAQLKILIDNAQEKDLKMKLNNFQLKLQVCYEFSGEAGVNFWVFTSGADMSKMVTQELTLNLELDGEGYVYSFPNIKLKEDNWDVVFDKSGNRIGTIKGVPIDYIVKKEHKTYPLMISVDDKEIWADYWGMSRKILEKTKNEEAVVFDKSGNRIGTIKCVPIDYIVKKEHKTYPLMISVDDKEIWADYWGMSRKILEKTKNEEAVEESPEVNKEKVEH